jgi:hypothetical protein
MPVENPAALAPEALDEVKAAVASHRTLEDVMRWGLLQQPPALVADVVVQDEFTHDVVVPWRAHWLVHDTT